MFKNSTRTKALAWHHRNLGVFQGRSKKETARGWNDERKWFQSNFIAPCLECRHILESCAYLAEDQRRCRYRANWSLSRVWACVHEHCSDFTSTNKKCVRSKQKLRLELPVGTACDFLAVSLYCALNETFMTKWWSIIFGNRVGEGESQRVWERGRSRESELLMKLAWHGF